MIEPYSSSGRVALTCPSTRSGSGVVNVSSLGTFGKCAQVVDGRELGGVPDRRLEEADCQVGARPVEVDRVEPPLGKRGRAPLQRLHPLRPRGDGIVLVEPAHVGDRLPELVERIVGLRVGIDDLGPFPRRSGRDAPVRRPAVDDLARAREVGEEIETRAVAGHVIEGMGRMRAAERDPGGVLAREVLHAIRHPWRDVRERLRIAVEQPLALDPLVRVPDVDELGTTRVGGSRDLAGQFLLADVARDAEQLTRLNVGPELHDQIGKAAGQVGVVAHRVGE